MQRKGSYFYVIDAFIASIIILGVIVFLTNKHQMEQRPAQPLYTAEDFLSTIDSMQVRTYDSELIRNWTTNGTIGDPKQSMLRQLAIFSITGNQDNNTGKLAESLAGNTPQNMGIEILVDGDQHYIRYAAEQSTASSLLTSKRIVLMKKNITTLYDPVIIEVRTWQ